MSRRRYRNHSRRDTLGALVNDSAHIAVRFGPVGALTIGVIGFTVFYMVLPSLFMVWSDANKAQLTGPAAVLFTKLIDQLMWQRFINPCHWAGVAILLTCSAIAAWKVLAGRELTCNEIDETNWLAKLMARWIC